MLTDARCRVNLLRLYLALDRSTEIGFSVEGVSIMKTSMRYCLASLLILAAVGLTVADDFKSITFDTASSQTIRIHGDQFMLIRNFTQEGGSDRGVISVNELRTNQTATVLTAAILDPSSPTVEVINTVIIAGPADVTFTCGSDATGNCFVSYKKASN